MAKSNSPKHLHDALFKQTMLHPQAARDFFEAHLPESLKKQVNLDSIEPLTQSYLTPAMRRTHSDVVFSIQFAKKTKGYIVILAEHQRTADPLMAFRMHRYIIEFLAQHVEKTKDKTLPVVIPMCVYHGDRSPYPYSRDIYDLFKDKPLAKQWFGQPFELIDLTVLSDEVIQSHGTMSVLELLFKYTATRMVKHALKQLATSGQLQAMSDQLGDTYLKQILEYMLTVYEDDPDDVIDCVKSGIIGKEGVIMNAAEQLIQRGVKQGIEQGVETCQEKVVTNMLRKGFSYEIILETAEITPQKLKQIQEQLRKKR